jgi:hypothetical protein
MTLRSFILLSPAILSGGLLAHYIWPDRTFKSLLVKLFLGVGLGLGLNSILYLIFLLIFNRKPGFVFVQIFVLVTLIFLVISRERAHPLRFDSLKLPNPVQSGFLLAAGGTVVLALLTYASVSLGKPHGAWDSWMIYNRAARFIFRGGDHWLDVFSPDLYWYFHADYPPMLSLNIASGWAALGQESIRMPMALGGAFLFGSAGLMFAGLNAYKTLGQATLGMIVLLTISDYIEMGSKQVADIPLSFFILATGVLVFLYSLKKHRGILVLAGLSAGLAGWTKNEGIVFILVSLIVLGIANWKNLKTVFPWYLLGLALPMWVVLYFKIALAPPGDLFVDIPSQLRQITDTYRHHEILKQLRSDVMSLLNWKLLLVYGLILGVSRPGPVRSAYVTCGLFILLQLAGYYSIFLISPHHILWHISALYRLLLQIGPLIVFFYFCVVRPPETVFQPR